MKNEELLEKLANLEHEQWMTWSKDIAEMLDAAMAGLPVSDLKVAIMKRLERWETMWIPYSELSEDVKPADRLWALKVLDIIDGS